MPTAWQNIRRWLALRWRPIRQVTLWLLVLLIVGLLHGVILRLLAWPLQAGDPSAAGGYFCIRGSELGADGYQPFDAAAAWHGKLAGGKVLLLLPHTARIVEIGAVRSFEEACRGELGKRRIPAGDIETLRADALDVWGEAHAFSDWLKQRPGATVVLACSPFGSGRLRHVFDKVLGPADARRVQLTTLPDPRCRIESWWRSRKGVKEFMDAWLDLAYVWAAGDAPRPCPSSAAQFQQAMRARIGEAPP